MKSFSPLLKLKDRSQEFCLLLAELNSR